MSRPEHFAPPEVFYNAAEASKYGGNTRMIEIQTKMAERALQLLKLEKPGCILDIGCGSGISGEVLADGGHYWVGMDISPYMLLVAKERETDGDLMLSDMGQGFKYKPGSFDGAISISALQWLCNRDKTTHNPFQRLRTFFQSLFNVLVQGSRAVLQFYPEDENQLEMITAAAMRSGFNGGVVVDYPHSAKAKKYFLVLNAGMSINQNQSLPQGLTGEEETIKVAQRETKKSKKKGKAGVKTKSWIMKKKDQMRDKGREVAKDSKFTGRKRKPRF